MDTFWGLSGTAWTAIYTLLTAGLLAVAIIAALYAHRQWRISRQQAAEARRAQLEAMRPYVIVSAPPMEGAVHLFNLSVKNIGVRPAQNVRVTLDPPPLRAKPGPAGLIADIKMLNEPISLIPPGHELTCFYDTQLERAGRDDLPKSHRALVTYEDMSGTKYEEQMVIDLEVLKGTSFIDLRTVNDVAKELKRIREQLGRSPLLDRRASVEVAAVVETRPEHLKRVAHDEYVDNIKLLHRIRRFRPDDTRQIELLEASIAAYEAEHPSTSARRRPAVTRVRRSHPRRRSAAGRL